MRGQLRGAASTCVTQNSASLCVDCVSDVFHQGISVRGTVCENISDHVMLTALPCFLWPDVGVSYVSVILDESQVGLDTTVSRTTVLR